MSGNWVIGLLGAGMLAALCACSHTRLPPEQKILSYPGDDATAPTRAATACAAYNETAEPLGIQTAADGSKLAAFKCQ